MAYILHKYYICNCFSDLEIQTQDRILPCVGVGWFVTTHFFLRSSCSSSRATGAIKFYFILSLLDSHLFSSTASVEMSLGAVERILLDIYWYLLSCGNAYLNKLT